METLPQNIMVLSCRFGWGYCGHRDAPADSPVSWMAVDCCGCIEPEQILDAFRDGRDGVLILACNRGGCHFQDGEWQCLKRVELLKPLLAAHGIRPERLCLLFGNDPAGASMPGLLEAFRRRLAP